MDHEIFDGVYFSPEKFLKVIKSKKTIQDVIEFVKDKVDILDDNQCNENNLQVIKHYKMILEKDGFVSKKNFFDVFEKILVWLIPYFTTMLTLIISLFLKVPDLQTKYGKEVVKVICKAMWDLGGILFWVICGFGVLVFIIYSINNYSIERKQHLSLAYSMLEKCFEEKIQELKK